MNNITYHIDTLSVSEEAKEVLRRTLRVASSTNSNIKESVKSLFVVCPHGACLSEYARTYERIIIENDVYKVTGKGTYLELAFPKMGTEKEYAAFYNSARLVAATINSYTGVFLLSFERFNGYNDLMKEPAFAGLLKYIDMNAKNISFVFHVNPEFGDKEKLANTLKGHVNLLQVSLAKPGIVDATEYVTGALNKTNIFFTKAAKKKLSVLVAEKIDFESVSYLGYRTLDRFTSNVAFEVACICDENEKGMRTIDTKIISQLAEAVDFSLEDKEMSYKLGFR